MSGPLNNGGLDLASKNSYKFNGNPNEIKSDLHERISNIETCLNMEVDDQNYNIYEKIKSIEDRLLQLENEMTSNNKKILFSNIQHTETTNYNNCVQVNQLLFILCST